VPTDFITGINLSYFLAMSGFPPAGFVFPSFDFGSLFPLPPLPELSLQPDVAVRGRDGETTGGSTPFRFTVTRTGDTSGESSAAWAVAGRGPNALGASDFAGNVLPSGTVRFRPGETSRTVRVEVLADPEQEQTRRFNLSLSEPSGATLGAALAKGALAKGNLVGSGGADQIFGSRAPELIQGREGRDLLTGSGGADGFSFRFGDSPITAPDRITDHTLGVDKIAIRNRQGDVQARPLAFSRAADNSTATTLEELAAAVCRCRRAAAGGPEAGTARGCCGACHR
jgi:hypothetical protein